MTHVLSVEVTFDESEAVLIEQVRAILGSPKYDALIHYLALQGAYSIVNRAA